MGNEDTGGGRRWKHRPLSVERRYRSDPQRQVRALQMLLDVVKVPKPTEAAARSGLEEVDAGGRE